MRSVSPKKQRKNSSQDCNGGAFDRVRFLQKSPKEVFEAASESATYLNYEPVLARFELVYYLREIAIGIDYHRYGNLGTREGEVRAEIF